MTQQIRKRPHSAEFKFKVAMEALRGEITTAEICQKFGIVGSQVYQWKKALVDNGASVFKGPINKNSQNAEVESLHATIGKLKVENDFLSKFAGRCR